MSFPDVPSVPSVPDDLVLRILALVYTESKNTLVLDALKGNPVPVDYQVAYGTLDEYTATGFHSIYCALGAIITGNSKNVLLILSRNNYSNQDYDILYQQATCCDNHELARVILGQKYKYENRHNHMDSNSNSNINSNSDSRQPRCQWWWNYM